MTAPQQPAHTAEPLSVMGSLESDSESIAIGNDGPSGPVVFTAWPMGDDFNVATDGPAGMPKRDANAARLVACWNALIGLNPKAVAECVALLGNIAAEADFGEDDGALEMGERLLSIGSQARAALAKLKGTS